MRLFFILFLFGCGGTEQLITRGSGIGSGALGAGAGVVATKTIEKVKKDIKEISTLAPYLNISALEVCYHTESLGPDWLECVITPCKDDTNCKRAVRKSIIDPYKIVYINEKAWINHAGEIKALCTSPHKNFRDVCRFHAKNYEDVDKLLIVGEE